MSRFLVALLLLTQPVAVASEAGVGEEVEVRGTVADGEGVALGVVAVRVAAPEGDGFAASTQADSRGRFRLRLPRADQAYQLRLEKVGYRVLEHSIRPQVLMAAGEQRLELNFTLQRLHDLDPGRDTRDRNWPNTSWDAYRQALSAIQGGQLDEGRQRLLAALELEPRFPPANGAMAWFYQQEGDFEAALAAADTFLRYHDTATGSAELYHDTLKVRLDALFALGDWETALAAADGVLALERQEPEALRIRYLCLYQLGREGEVAAAQEALRGADSALGAAIHLHNQGVLQLRRGDHAEAARHFGTAVELDPKLTPAWSGLAKSHFLAGNHAPALAAAERLQQLQPDSREALAIRYDSRVALGEAEQARPLLELLVTRDPSPETARRLHQEGFRAATAGDLETAAARFRQAIALDPQLAVSHRALSTVLYQQGDYAAALAAAEHLLQLIPDDLQAPELAAKARRALPRR